MKYPEIKQIIETMENAGYDYKGEISAIETAITTVSSGASLGLNAHVKAMILALLSNERDWEDIKPKLPQIEDVFCGYDRDKIKKKSEQDLLNEIIDLRAGNRQIKRQIESIKDNIAILERIDSDFGGIDCYYSSIDKYDLLDMLSNGKSNYKLKAMGVPLVCEYLKGVGVKVIKPDRHVCRILGRLHYSKRCPAGEIESLRICDQVASEMKLSHAMVDTILWQYCANDKFEVCIKDKPKCEQCGVYDCPSRTCPSKV